MKSFVIMLLFLISLNVFAITAEEIIEKVDYNMTPTSIVYKGKMLIHKGEKTYTKVFEMYAVGNSNGFVEFLSPVRDKGTKYLRKDKNLWIYFPKANRTIKISGHMLRQNMMGSDISYEDQTDRNDLASQYDVKILKEDDNYYVLELLAKPNKNITYYKRILKIDKSNFTIKESDLYAKSGKLLKEMKVNEIKKVGNRYYITKFKMDDKIKKDSYTEIIVTDLKIDENIPDSTFTIKNLERKLELC